MAFSAANTIQPSSLRTPFLNLPQSIRTECVPTFTQLVNETIRLSQCRASQTDAKVENISTTLKLDNLNILATNGTAIDIETAPGDKSCFIVPFETKAVLHINQYPFEVSHAQNIIYVPSKPWRIEVESSLLSMLVIVVESRTVQAAMASLSNPRQRAKSLEEILSKPVLLSTETSHGASLLNYIHANLRFIESVIGQSRGTMPQYHLGDLLLRQLMFLWNERWQRLEQAKDCVLEFNQLVDWMRQHCCEPLCLADLELRSGYTGRNLQRSFQKRFGCGPMQYLRKERLKIACHKLESAPPGTHILDIAKACGYGSASSFSRDFKEAYSETPAKKLGCLWRQSH
jgi:AraC-like DNA-binding protein